jgi:transcriptional regulator with XRE-family HTH domain
VSEVKTTSLAAFGSQLKAWRQQMGWTQVEAGGKLGYSASLVSGIETMDKAPTADFAARCDALFGTPGTFTTLQELVSREAYPAFFAPVVPFEREAVRIHGWEHGAIPGLLQTDSYARALIKAGRPTDSDSATERLVSARMERQNILISERPPMLWYVIDEGPLRHLVGDAEIMGDQLDKLIDAAGRPGIVIQVLPFSADNRAGSDGPITVYEFSEAPTVCYTECFAGGRIVERNSEVADLMTVISLIRVSALSPQKSVTLMRRIRSDLDGEQ